MGRRLIVFIIFFGMLVGGGFLGYVFTTGHNPFAGPLTYEKAKTRLANEVEDIRPVENYVQRRANLELGASRDLKKNLPDIAQFPLVVDPPRTGGHVVVEIFTSTEKSGEGIDGIMVEIARDFNARNQPIGDGRRGKVAIRKIASGAGHDYIAARKYLPEGFSPSNHLWVRMVEAHGVPMTPVRERMAANIAGIVMKEAVANELRTVYGELNVKNIIDAVVQGSLVMGYTDPFASSTGLNFLVTVLATFADGDPAAMLTPEVVSSFESFQRGVPFVALTTLQMRDSVMNEGSLDAFVMEYQTFVHTPVLKSGYEFIPFGIRHDNPLYAVGDVSPEEMEVLKAFGEFAGERKYAQLAARYGFQPNIQHTPPFEAPPGDVLVRAQKTWKEKKDAGRPIAAIFLCDVSGSMRGDRLGRLKTALLEGAEFISPQNSIGLVVFNQQVSRILPIKPFDLNQKAAFHAAVQDMSADGPTAMYDGIAVSLEQLVRAKEQNPNVKPLLFVLTDGETNRGLIFPDMEHLIPALNIPIYTIGYEADIEELKRVSSLVEAASLNAGEGEIAYKIGALLNAQM
ncbi:MAG: vWA domain-containing protein [Desulfococcaceae bacterium]